jgi:hypothetical protein
MKFFGFLIKKSFVDVDGPFLCLQNGGNLPPEFFFFCYLINIYFKFFKSLDRFIVISKIKLNMFQINLMLELFMCLKLELL